MIAVLRLIFLGALLGVTWALGAALPFVVALVLSIFVALIFALAGAGIEQAIRELRAEARGGK